MEIKSNIQYQDKNLDLQYKYRNKICKFGIECFKNDCLFEHPIERNYRRIKLQDYKINIQHPKKTNKQIVITDFNNQPRYNNMYELEEHFKIDSISNDVFKIKFTSIENINEHRQYDIPNNNQSQNRDVDNVNIDQIIRILLMIHPLYTKYFPSFVSE